MNLAWLLRLRWGAIAGQAVTILIVDRLLRVPLPMLPLYAIIGIELASNLALGSWIQGRRVVPESVLTAIMTLDVLLLTGLLYFAGGSFNPFNFLYLVHIALAAVILRSRWTWGLAALSFVCFGALFLEQSFQEHSVHHHQQPGVDHDHAASHADFRMHLYGMWVAFGVAAAFIAHFVTRVTRDLRRREQELAEARALAARSKQLASLATLAAGAAHELSTPLSTIAVVAKELERNLQRDPRADEQCADARLIREEVARCREILTRMAARAGSEPTERGPAMSLDQLIEAALSNLPASERVEVALDAAARNQRLEPPPDGLVQALRCVAQNAQQATAGSGEVRITATREADRYRIEVRDSGTGMTADVLARAGEPFFTTKQPGRGMGLGLFVARTALEREGGRLELHSTEGKGTIAVLTIPVPPARDNAPHRDRARPQEALEPTS